MIAHRVLSVLSGECEACIHLIRYKNSSNMDWNVAFPVCVP